MTYNTRNGKVLVTLNNIIVADMNDWKQRCEFQHNADHKPNTSETKKKYYNY